MRDSLSASKPESFSEENTRLSSLPILSRSSIATAPKMKVAIATAFPLDPSQPHGGVEAVSVALVRAGAKYSDLDIHVATVCDEVNTPRVDTWEGATIHRFPAQRGPLLWNALIGYRQLIRNWAESVGADLLHAHDTYGLMVRGLSLPHVFTVHGFIYEDTRYRGGISAAIRARLWKHFEMRSWAEHPHIISISPYVRERLRCIATGEIHDIENPIDEACFAVSPDRGHRIIFSAAVISRRKNTLGLLKAFAALRSKTQPVQLRLAGPMIEPDYAELVKDFIRQQQLEKSVVLLGPLTAQQVRAELARADVFALLSYEEGAPMGIAEALAAGVPVVTANRCGMPYMVRNGETGFLVKPDDYAAAADTFARILDDSEMADRMAQRCRADALDRYHPDSVAARTRAVYQQAIRGFKSHAS